MQDPKEGDEMRHYPQSDQIAFQSASVDSVFVPQNHQVHLLASHQHTNTLSQNLDHFEKVDT